MSYSQRDEEAAILGVFKDHPTGRFLDIGAYDGRTFSNTLALVERGWSGVCVEADPIAFAGLLKQHGGNEQIALIQACIAEGPGLKQWWSSGGDAVSTTVEAHKELWCEKGQRNFTAMLVATVGVGHILAACPGPYDFISIDTEGTSVDLLYACVAHGLFPKLYCIEHDRRLNDIRTLLLPHAYRTVHRNGENVLMERH